MIGGNHELSFDPSFTNPFSTNNCCKHQSGTLLLDDIPTLGNTKESMMEAVTTENIRQYLTNATYIEDEAIELCGLKIYGTP